VYSKKAASVTPAVPEASYPRIKPRLLRIADAADYLSCTFGFAETLLREGTIKPVILGKRHLCDIRDLDAYIDLVKEQTP